MRLHIAAGLAAVVLAGGACASADARRATPVAESYLVIAEPAPYSVFKEPAPPALPEESRAAEQRKWWESSGSYAPSAPPPRVYDVAEDDEYFDVPTHYDYAWNRSCYGYSDACSRPYGYAYAAPAVCVPSRAFVDCGDRRFSGYRSARPYGRTSWSGYGGWRR